MHACHIKKKVLLTHGQFAIDSSLWIIIMCYISIAVEPPDVFSGSSRGLQQPQRKTPNIKKRLEGVKPKW